MKKNTLRLPARPALILAGSLLFTASSQAVLVIAGVSDGDLTGGNPKAIILSAVAPVADLALWGVGSANNGGGTDGVEFTFPSGPANAGDIIVVAANLDSFNFFVYYIVQNFALYQSDAANINGDDAIEVFNNGVASDVYGDINVDGTGQSWDYVDGYAIGIGTGSGAFDQANYSSNDLAFDTLTEQQHIDVFVAAGFTQVVVPEPTSAALAMLGLTGLLRRRR